MRFIILIVVVVLVVAVGLVTMKFASDAGQPLQPTTVSVPVNSEVETVDVLVARVDTPVGTVLNDSMIDRQPWPKHLVLSGFIISGSADSNLNGMVARSDFKAREPFTATRLAKPNDASFLAAGLDKGMRAVTVSVDAISGVAGYIFPGDRVDVLFTHRVPQSAPQQMDVNRGSGIGSASVASGNSPTTSEVLLPNIRVLAVNTRQAKAEGQAAPTSDAPNSVTLALSQDEAKRLRLSEKNGTVSLSLRSVQDEGDAGVGTPVTLMDISRVEDAGSGGKWRQKRPDGSVAPMTPRADSDWPEDEVIIIRGVVTEDKPLSLMGSPASAGLMGMMAAPPLDDNY